MVSNFTSITCCYWSVQGYCDFLTEETLLQAVEVGHVMFPSSSCLHVAAMAVACPYLEDLGWLGFNSECSGGPDIYEVNGCQG
jgi:hypothetical protein